MEDELDQLAATMFRVFARFEYALKAADFFLEDGRKNAKPNWEKFAKVDEVIRLFEKPQDQELAEAIEYMNEHPPKKQVIENGVLAWSEVPPDTNLESDRILQYVRRVRNNLFHGGKFSVSGWDAPERTSMLLKHSLSILHACLDASPKVNEAYLYGQEYSVQP